ncbi:MAG: ribbon-helix-helix protein, CopG family [Candidatus Eremiobacteraeota bacterium]|nr:ribbon-helix-helix protein, CopG family [Candidatus Eremiobacteraeota bacterium]
MHRIQVQLTPEQERRLRELARLRKSSISALIREGIEAVIGPSKPRYTEEQVKRAMGLIGMLGDAERATDVARNHDRYLADILYENLHGE